MQSTQKPPAKQRRFFTSPRVLCILGFVLAYLVSLTTLAPQASAAALSAPGGNVADPVVRQVDIARPAVVRIATTINGQLNVRFSSTVAATFPQSGGSYALTLLGTGSFISAHGDILTADHVINPPRDQGVDDDLYQHAAQDVADFINAHFQVTTPYSAADAYTLLSSGSLPSTPTYTQPTSVVYLSTSYVGAINAAKLETVPATGKATVDRIEAQSSYTQNDVAIIHVSGMDNMPSIQLGDSSQVAEQDNLTIIGYPGLADLSQAPTDFLTSSINKIYVSALKTTDTGAPVIEVGGNVEHGDSGGPALDTNGNIVGIVSFGYSGINGQYGQTAFLQASSSAQALIKQLNLDTTPGTFAKAWKQAINDYSSSTAGHWQTAAKELQDLSLAYPNFLGINQYLNYAKNQANLEQNTSSSSSSNLTVLWIVLVILLLLAVLGGVFYWLIFKRNARPALVAPGAAQYPAGTYGAYQQQSGIYGPVPVNYGASVPQAQPLPGALPLNPAPVPSGAAYPNYTSPAAYGSPVSQAPQSVPGLVPQTPQPVPGPGVVPQTPQPIVSAPPMLQPWQSVPFPRTPAQTPQPAQEEIAPQVSSQPTWTPLEAQPLQQADAQPEPQAEVLPAELAEAAKAWAMAAPSPQFQMRSSASWPAVVIADNEAATESAPGEEEKTIMAQPQNRAFSVPRRPAVAEVVASEATVASPFTMVAPCGHTNAPDVRFCRICGQPVASTNGNGNGANGA